MDKGLNLIQRKQLETIDGYPTGNIYIGVTQEEYSELEKELKSLEIIKKKNVDIAFLIVSCDLKHYNEQMFFNRRKELTQEEYDLLKEVLL